MGLNPFKTSRHAGNAIDAYEFSYGESKLRYASTERPVSFEGETFVPLAIERDAIKTKARETGNQFKINVPRTCEIAQLFQGTPPRHVVFVRVYEGDIAEFDSPEEWTPADPVSVNLVFVGRVLEAQHKSDRTILSCDNLAAGMKRPGLHRFYQRECPFVLYGARCQADEAAATSTHVVINSSPGGRSVPVGGDWADVLTDAERDNHIGGLFRFTGPNGPEVRRIVNVGRTAITLDSSVGGLLFEGDSFNVTLGCQRTPTACANLHDNIVNYGGMPYIPEIDPHGKNNHT